MTNALYLTPILLLCADCQRPIPATVTTERWIKVGDWIGPGGECRDCYRQRKEQANEVDQG